MPKLNVGPRIDEKTAKWYDDYFPNRNAGVTFAINFFPEIYSITLKELRGKFEKGELGMILDVENGGTDFLLASGVAMGVGVTHNIFDSFHLYPGMYEEKWEIDRKKMQNKMQSLTFFQQFCLKYWCCQFWDRSDEINLNEYISTLLKPDQEGYIAPEPKSNLNP